MTKLVPNTVVKAERCKRSFYFFLQEFWSEIIAEEPVYNWHIKYLCDKLQELAVKVKNREEIGKDFVINVPPSTSKSTIISQMFPVWCWVLDPSIKLITGSHSMSLSTRDSVKSRDILRSQKFRAYFPEIRFKADGDNKTKYENDLTGSRIATSVTSYITGEHAHIIIADDPLNAAKVPSEATLQKANDWIDYVKTTRKIDEKKAVLICLMQRVHENDCSGHLLKDNKNIEHICLPAELSDKVKPEEAKKLYVDGVLDNKRLPKDVLAKKKKGLGTYGYAGQYGQTPTPEGGGILKKIWFNEYDAEMLKRRAKDADEDIVWNFVVDGAYTADTSNDQSAILAYTTIKGNTFIRAVLGVWEELPDFVRTLTNFVVLNGYTSDSRIFVEPKASGLPIVQTLKAESNLNMVIDKAPTTDKVARVRSVSAYIEAGRCYLLRNGQGITDLLYQCETFPNGKLKDMIDCLTMALDKTNNSSGEVFEVSFA